MALFLFTVDHLLFRLLFECFILRLHDVSILMLFSSGGLIPSAAETG